MKDSNLSYQFNFKYQILLFALKLELMKMCARKLTCQITFVHSVARHKVKPTCVLLAYCQNESKKIKSNVS